jgi:ABC-2 type transport system ATP-binding protein
MTGGTGSRTGAESESLVLEARAVGKSFTTFERQPGVLGVLKNFVARQSVVVHALENIDLQVRRGETIGLIGANGAGKTTLVKILTGIVPATSGEARLFGRDSFELRDQEKARLALVMGQKSQLWWDLPPIDSFRLLKEIYSIPTEAFDRRVAEFTKMLDVEDRLKIQLRQLSLGQRMKMEIIGAFLHDPEVVFLDEPTIGLDLVSREVIRQFLVRLSEERGVTFVLTSHDLEDIEETCKRIVVLDSGRMAFDGDLAGLTAQVTGKRAIEVHVDPHVPIDELALGRDLLAFGAEIAGRGAAAVTVIVDADRLPDLVPALFKLLDVRDLSVERQPLEHLVREIYRRSERDGASVEAARPEAGSA